MSAGRSEVMKKGKMSGIIKSMKASKFLLCMVLPGILFYYILFCYVPLHGIVIAFKDFTFNKGIWGSDWAGLSHFRYLFKLKDFWQAVRNTVFISTGRIVFEFPIPIIVAVLLNEMRLKKTKRVYQTVYTFPYFISWVVASGIFFNLLSSDGVVNRILAGFGMETIGFMSQSNTFFALIFASNTWKNMGWDCILFLAAITGINPELYEAAVVDGANRFQKIIHITWPGILATVSIVLILRIGNFMNSGFDQIFNMYSAPVYSISDIIDTYIYRISFQSSANFSLGVAAGLFKSVINFVLLFVADRVVKSFGQQGIY